MNDDFAGARGSLSIDDLLAIRDAFQRLGEDGFEVRWAGAFSSYETRLDTADRRFLRAGYSLAVRECGARTDLVLEPCSPRPDRPALRITAPLAAGGSELDLQDLPGNLREAVRAVAGRARLSTVERREVHRHRFGVARRDRLAGAVTLVEVRPDGGEVETEPDRRVELDMADREDLRDFVTALHARLPRSLRIDAPPAGSSDNRSRWPRSRGGSIADAAFGLIRRELARCLDHEPGARLGVDPEELHEMRVATRRMRAAARVHRAFLPRGRGRLAGELRWLGSVLGPVRDLDVQIDWLEHRAREFPVEDRPVFRRIEAALQRRRETARRQMLEALDSDRYARFVERTSAWLARGPGDHPERGRRSAKRTAPRLIQRRMKKLLRAGATLRADGSPVDYHRVRILAKRARYTLEFHAERYGKPARRVLRRLVRVQDLLGEHQDIVVFLDRLPALLDDAGGETDESACRVLDGMRQLQLARASELLGEFPDAFASLKRALRRAES
jgi:CHAD domain-containing protein